MTSTADRIARAKAEILADMAEGVVPATVSTFAALHDYVDANEYGGLCEPLTGEEEDGFVFESDSTANDVQSALDEWLRDAERCVECDGLVDAGDEPGHGFYDNGAEAPLCSEACTEKFYA